MFEPDLEFEIHPAKLLGKSPIAWKIEIYGKEIDLPRSTAVWVNKKKIKITTWMAKKKKLRELRERYIQQQRERRAALVQPQQRRRSAPVPRIRVIEDERWNELSTVLKCLLEHGNLSNPEIARLTGIDVGNIPRSRMKLYYLGLVDTYNFKTIFLTAKGRRLKGTYIKDDLDFNAVNKKWTDAKRRYLSSIQPGIFDDEE